MASFEWPSSGSGGGGGGNLPTHLAADVTALSSGSESVSVIFGTVFSVAPVVTGTVFSTNAGAVIISLLGIASTTSGFTAQLSAAPTDTTYSLNWIASAVND